MRKFPDGRRPIFPGQNPAEKIFLLTRQHWFILARRIFLWFMIVLILTILNQVATTNLPFLNGNDFGKGLQIIRELVAAGLIIGLFSIWVIYYLNYQVITNERIVDIDQKGILNHHASELHLYNVEDVSVEIKGIFATMLNYGTVYVQTAAEMRNFEFNYIPNPHQVAKLVLQLFEKLPEMQKTKKYQD